MKHSTRLVICLLIILAPSVFAEDLGSRVSFQLNLDTPAANYYPLFEGEFFTTDWSNGWGVKRIGDPRTANQYFAMSANGEVREGVFSLPGAVSATIIHSGVTTDGDLVFAGNAYMRDRTPANYIARLDESGRVEQFILTGSFVPRAICVAPDDTVWSLGGDLNAHEFGEEYAVLRHFDLGEATFRDVLFSTAFERSRIPSYNVNTQAYGFSGSAWLRCDARGAYVYSDLPVDELIEVEAIDYSVSRRDIDMSDHPGAAVSSLILTPVGDFVASLTTGHDQENTWNVVLLQRTSTADMMKWVKIVDEQTLSAASGGGDVPTGLRLFGNDGNRILVETLGRDRARHHSTRWAILARDAER